MNGWSWIGLDRLYLIIPFSSTLSLFLLVDGLVGGKSYLTLFSVEKSKSTYKQKCSKQVRTLWYGWEKKRKMHMDGRLRSNTLETDG